MGKQVVMLDVNTPKGWEWGLHLGKEIGTTLSSAYGGRSKKVHAFAYLDAGEVGAGKKFTIHCHDQEFPATQLEKEYVAFTGGCQGGVVRGNPCLFCGTLVLLLR